MIFDIKQQDMRYKARLVMGRNVIDSPKYSTFLSTIENLSVKLLFLVAVQNGLDLMCGDIGNAFPTAPCAEKIWSTAGAEFGSWAGSTMVLKRAFVWFKNSIKVIS